MKQKRAKDSLKELSVRPSKQRGQNFIIDPSVIGTIVDFGSPAATDKLVEIGPGLGALTEELQKVAHLTAIEIEPKFCEDLRQRYPNIKIVNQDVRQVEFSSLGEGLTVFGNLPYAFSTEIVFHLIDSFHSIKRAILLLQKEFAERMAANPGGKDYGVLSISCQLWADLKLGPVIRGDAFHPRANVDSRLVELSFLPSCRYQITDLVWFKKVVKAAFLQRRKKIVNSIMAAGIVRREALMEALARASISPDCRAEMVSISAFVALSEELLLGNKE